MSEITQDVAVRRGGEVAVPGVGGALVPTAAAIVSDTVARWADDIENCGRLASRLVQTELVPASYWPLPAGVKLWNMPGGNPRVMGPNESPESYQARLQVATATVAGTFYTAAMLGVPWNAGLQGIDYVRGRQSMRAEFMVSLYLSAGHEMVQHLPVDQRPEKQKDKDGERSDTRAAAWWRRRGDTEWELVEFTIEEATAAGFVKGQGPDKGKDKGNEKYLTQPKVMLWARMTSTAVRKKTPEVLRGIACVEEVTDEPEATVTADVVEQAAPRAVAAAVLAAAAPAPAPAAVAAAPAPAAVEPEPGQAPAAPVESGPQVQISDKTWARINSRFVELGVTGQGQTAKRFAVIAAVTGRTITRGGELTEEEGSDVLAHLSADLVREVLAPRPAVDEAAAAAGHAMAEAEQVAEVLDQDGYGDYDPTAEADWPMDGAEAAAEGQP